MGRLILIRHCASTSQHPEAPLTEAGAAAAEALADRLAELAPDAVYSSPYARAIATVAPFAERVGLPLTTEVRLRERLLAEPEVDDWLEHIRRSFEDADHRAPGGESRNQVQARALAALAEIDARGHRLPIAASHGGLISAVLRAVDPTFGFDGWRTLANPDLFELVFETGRLTGWRRLAWLVRTGGSPSP
jgi:2,3-bisphosphoglycerate-dependent phosphoglycerate mutase